VRLFTPLAGRLVQRYRGSGLSEEDLMQVACLGLVLAIDRFDPDRGYEFSSFAVPTILGELRRHFRDFGWALHLRRSEQELVMKVNHLTEQLAQRLGRSPKPQEIADASDLDVEQVVRALEAASGARPRSLDEPFDEEGEAELARRASYEEGGFELVERRDAVVRGLEFLTPREHQVLYLRFFEDRTQAEIAKRIGVSQMHVSRILRRALERSQQATRPPDSD
jgi:RNA polymerase sigma-B factor